MSLTQNGNDKIPPQLQSLGKNEPIIEIGHLTIIGFSALELAERN